MMSASDTGTADTPFENNTKMYRVLGMPSFSSLCLALADARLHTLPPGPYYPLANPENKAHVLQSVTTFETLVYKVVTFNVGDWVVVRGSFSSLQDLTLCAGRSNT